MHNNLHTCLRLSLCLLLSTGVHGGAILYDWAMSSSAPSLVQTPVIVSVLPASDVVWPEASLPQPSLIPDAAETTVKHVPQADSPPPNASSHPESAPAKSSPEKTPIVAVTKESPTATTPSEMVYTVPQEVIFENLSESFSQDVSSVVSAEAITLTEEVPVNSPQSMATVLSAGVAAARSPSIDAVPDYRSNPLPEYPYLARQKRWEGVVWLLVDVSATGSVDGLQIEQSCGHRVLDRAATRTVRRWQFSPATRAGIPVSSQVRLPIRFQLKEN